MIFKKEQKIKIKKREEKQKTEEGGVSVMLL